MNSGRIVLGGVVGGIVYCVISMVINIAGLGSRYQVLQDEGVFRRDPRLPFLPLYLLLLILVSIGLVWLYAAARMRLGPGPTTALAIGLVVGLMCAAPGFLSGYSWTYQGGVVNLLWAIERVVGSAAATLTGAWLYKE